MNATILKNSGSPLFNRSVYFAQNRCTACGLEKPVLVERLPDGQVLRIYVDTFNQHRAIIFKTGQCQVGYAGVLIGRDSVVRWRECNPADRGKGTTRHLLASLTVAGIRWYASDYQTEQGAACYSKNSNKD